MRAKELSEKLSENVESIARDLLPAGQLSAGEWCVGSVNGEEGKSLKICLSGSRAGVWRDFAGDEGGDLLDLIRATRGLSLSDAMQWGLRFLGVEEMKPQERKAKQVKPPLIPNTAKKIESAPVALTYLIGRGLAQETLQRFRIAGDHETIFLPFYSPDKKLTMLKQLKIERIEGKKNIRPTSKDQKKILFGWQALPDSARTVVLCEGELNAISVSQMGFNALAVPFGAGKGNKQDWVENEYDNLERFDEIFLWFDQDRAGKEAIPELLTRLGRERCRVIKSPDDANDVLQEIGRMEALVNDSEEMAPSNLVKISSMEDKIWDRFSDKKAHLKGLELPWLKIKNKFVFRMAEVTMFAGRSGHGKTLAVGQMVQHVLHNNGQVCMASMEGPLERTVSNILKQHFRDSPQTPTTREGLSSVLNWWNQSLFLYGTSGGCKKKDMMEVFKYCRRRYGVKFFVVDNLTTLDIGLDDYNAQRDFIKTLVAFATAENVHILLVGHMKKTGDFKGPGDKDAIKGSGALTDLVDNVFIWWRNQPKEEARRNNDPSKNSEPDALLKCEKDREEGDEFRLSLWFFPGKGKVFIDNPEGDELPKPQTDEWDHLSQGATP